MVWTTNLAIIIVLTTLTGSAMYGIWFGIGKLLERIGFINIIYVLLHVCLIFWYIPFAYIFLFLGNVPQYLWGGFQFLNTPILHIICAVFVIAWIGAVLFFLFRYIRDMVYIRKRYSNPIPCGYEQEALFSQVCKELGVSEKRIRFALDPYDGGPKIVGLFRPVILLPLDRMKDEALRVVLYHELTHYRQRDVWLKHVTYLAKVLHCFNPLIYLLDRQVQKWGEYACDYDVIMRLGGNMKYYFEVLMQLLSEVPRQKDNLLVTQMAQGKSELYDRVLRMNRSYKMMKKKKSRLAAALVVSLMVILSTSSVYASTLAVGEGYMAAYNATVVQEEDVRTATIAADGMIEYEVSGLEAGFVEEIYEVSRDTIDNDYALDAAGTYSYSNSYSIAWAIRKGGAARGILFHKNAGETIMIMAEASPSTATFRMGIVEPDGTRRYVEGTDFMAHRFELDQTGNYCIYIQNMSDGSIDVYGSYKY